MADFATFLGPNGAPASAAIRATVAALGTITVGDLLYVGQGYKSRIRERTFAGTDVNGAPFAPYSERGPFYLYVNHDATGSRSVSGTGSLTAKQFNEKRKSARATAAAGRFAKTGRIGIRTPTGIKYESYAAAKSAHGSGVNLYGMEQHPHMLDLIMVRAGGSEVSGATGSFDFGSEFEAFSSNQPCTNLALGFYGDEALRAEGNNEGTGKGGIKREFFALNASDLAWGEKAIAERLVIRARAAA